MGHWSENLIDEAVLAVGGNPDRKLVADVLAEAGHEIDVLSGRSFHPLRRTTSTFISNGLPFADVPDMQLGSIEAIPGVFAVPDPVNPQMATVLQLTSLAEPLPSAAPLADGLWFAGQVLADVARSGGLSRDYVLHWLNAIASEDRLALMRQVVDPDVRLSVPIVGVEVGGWWIQIARRLIWITNQTADEGRLVEILLDKANTGAEVFPLAATEPIMIVAPLTHQPARWAFTARIWTAGTRRPTDRPWSKIAKAIHGHGLPTITLDSESTPYEIGCQVLLKGYWHGYISRTEPAVANALTLAYPRQVARIQRVTQAPNPLSAAAILLEQLMQPGFDPAQGAEATRRYVRRKANIAVMEYRKAESPGRYPWTQVGISERRYYKLLPLFAQKVDGRYEVDQADVVARMKAHLDQADQARAIRTAALEVLHSHGFQRDAARKWLQRHPPEAAVDAWPRNTKPADPNLESAP